VTLSSAGCSPRPESGKETRSDASSRRERPPATPLDKRPRLSYPAAVSPESDTSPGRLRNISDTALWVAAYRAEESERPDAHFRDPFARRLAGERGFELLAAMPKGRALSWPMVVRTVLFDDIVRRALAEGVDRVVNLAAGLDARPYRMQLPAGLSWVEVDLPEILDYKSSVLYEETPACKLERRTCDLSDVFERRELFGRLGEGATKVLILTEGLLIYLQREQVEGLAADLAAVPAFRHWGTDLASPGLLRRMSSTWGKEVAAAGAPFQFAPQEGPDFFRPFGWRPRSVENSFYNAGRLKRLPLLLRLFTLFPEPKRWNPKFVWSGVCHLERD